MNAPRQFNPSPDLKGIKTKGETPTAPTVEAFNPSPDLKGIKTDRAGWKTGKRNRSTPALISKGLRLRNTPPTYSTNLFNPSPDLKGIKTKSGKATFQVTRFNPSPDLKGIKTMRRGQRYAALERSTPALISKGLRRRWTCQG